MPQENETENWIFLVSLHDQIIQELSDFCKNPGFFGLNRVKGYWGHKLFHMKELQLGLPKYMNTKLSLLILYFL